MTEELVFESGETQGTWDLRQREALLDAICNVDPTGFISAIINLERIEHESFTVWLKSLFNEDGTPKEGMWKKVQ